MHRDSIAYKAATSLERLRPRLREIFGKDETALLRFESRLNRHFPALFELLLGLYGGHYDFFYWLEQILTTTAQAMLQRPTSLTRLDDSRPANWFQSERVVGGVLYVDLYAGDLRGVREKIPYFKELGLTYLHLMPLFRCPPERNDGGYAVSSFREVNPTLGTMTELSLLAEGLRTEGISLVLDFVFNHTSDEHGWAQRAKRGDQEFQDYYLMFNDRTLPDQYERHLREIFPEQAPGNFTYLPELDKWVWTTFNTFQWDLNYANPAVFNQMLEEMLFLANQGVEVLRLDAVAFIWKQMGTSCENLPQAHDIIAAYNRLVRIAAPAMIFKSEAIVHPDEVVKYIGRECEISYNPTFMVLLWEALATRQVKHLRHTMAKRFNLPPGTAWVNYVRCHDDIGWSFANEDAAEVGINGHDHRNFLNQFYTGRFPGSFGRGLPFNYNPKTGDMRISGTLASLAGLEQAIAMGDNTEIDRSLRRILILQGLSIAAGGIPLIYLGDELGMLNDYSYRHDPAKNGDSRWVHRPKLDLEMWSQRNLDTPSGIIFQAIRTMIGIRIQHPAFSAAGKTLWLDIGNPHVLAFERSNQGQTILILANFSEQPQTVEARYLPPIEPGEPYKELLFDGELRIDLQNPRFTLPEYGMWWLRYP
ncbi:MAG: alpha-glucosidase C-terminal domain-containing protein [Anaerolinea sp.]|nr:alpha-glucosidase C-terminal domain-containing protein [Anaerolinea sp.]MCC6976006.1 alpha-glucosidase C-terminal domain-containing protein [Anaerolineae bacterium]CAG0979253.1 amylosucrase [Anaerolineae bacterium]